jgi:hypothetical protein
MNKIQIIIGLMLVFVTFKSVAENLKSLTDKTSGVIVPLSALDSEKEYEKKIAGKMYWEQGGGKQSWVNALLLKKQLGFIRYDQYQLKKYEDNVVENSMGSLLGLKGNNRNVYAQRYLKYSREVGKDEHIFTASKPQRGMLQTNLGVKGNVLSAQKLQRFKLGCEGSASNKWRIKMNMKTKRMWVNLTNASTFSIPITYSHWDNDNKKRLLVIAGKGKRYIKATIDHSRSCRLNFSKKRYTYAITANVARADYLSGCCSDLSN